MSDPLRDSGRTPVHRASRRPFHWRGLVALGATVAVLAVGGWLLLRFGSDARAAGRPSSPIASLTSPSPSPVPSATPTVIEIGWVGDTTPGSKYGLPPDGGRALFAHLRDQLLAPDLMIANLEGTYSTGGPSKSGGPNSFSFQAPPLYALALPWAGIDLVNLANNHSNDYLARGLRQTTQALQKAGIAYAGLPGQVTVLHVRGVRVAVLGMAFSTGSANVNNIPAAVRIVRRAAHEADVVVVLMHIGAEGADKIHTPHGTEWAFGERRGNPRAFAHAVIDAGADLVLGSGPHVIRGIERYKDRLIAYSLGNFAGWGNFALGGNLSLSGLLTVRIDELGRIYGGRWLSLSLTKPGVPAIDPADTAARLVRRLSAEDFAHTYTLDAKGFFSVTP